MMINGIDETKVNFVKACKENGLDTDTINRIMITFNKLESRKEK